MLDCFPLTGFEFPLTSLAETDIDMVRFIPSISFHFLLFSLFLSRQIIHHNRNHNGPVG